MASLESSSSSSSSSCGNKSLTSPFGEPIRCNDNPLYPEERRLLDACHLPHKQRCTTQTQPLRILCHLGILSAVAAASGPGFGVVAAPAVNVAWRDFDHHVELREPTHSWCLVQVKIQPGRYLAKMVCGSWADHFELIRRYAQQRRLQRIGTRAPGAKQQTGDKSLGEPRTMA